nr:MAG TPA: hypothetical protein [Caudoviricetes sp.]
MLWRFFIPPYRHYVYNSLPLTPSLIHIFPLKLKDNSSTIFFFFFISHYIGYRIFLAV